MKTSDDLYHFRDNVLNEVSPSFCTAKWKQVTLHLHSGQTHSCHHPVPHKIPLDEIADNPSALHNTKFLAHGSADLYTLSLRASGLQSSTRQQ